MLHLEEKHLEARRQAFLQEAVVARNVGRRQGVVEYFCVWSGRKIARFGHWLEAIGHPFSVARQE
jgi:hypothetical protein